MEYNYDMTEESDSTPAFDPPDPSLRLGMDDHDRVVSDPGAPVIIGVSFDSALKAQSDWRIIGSNLARLDIPAKTRPLQRWPI